MENVDKDVAAMLQSLKKYDKLVESCAPVLGMKTVTMNEKKKPDFLDVDKDEDKKEPMTKALKDKEKKGKKEEVKENDGGEAPWRQEERFKKEKEEAAKKKVDESTAGADQEVLEWMKRFSKLGNMKGYGR